MADVGQGEDGFAAVAFTTGDGGNGPGGGDGGLGSVTDAELLDASGNGSPVHGGAAPILLVFDEGNRRSPDQVVGVIDAAGDGREGAALASEVDACLHGGVAHVLHHLAGEIFPGGGAITHPDVVHQVSEPHDAQSDAPGAQSGFAELRHGRNVGIGIHDIIQEAGGQLHRIMQADPIHGMVGSEVLGQVHRTEAAVLVRAKPLLPAGIGGFEGIQVGDRVGAVGGVEEEDAGLTVMMGLFDDLLEEVAGTDSLVFLEGDTNGFGLFEGALEAFGAGIGKIGEAQAPIGIVADGLHEGIGDADGNIEVGDLVLVGLAGDEFFDVGMIDAQDGHVGSAAGAALGDLAEGVIIDAQEADGAGGLPG